MRITLKCWREAYVITFSMCESLNRRSLSGNDGLQNTNKKHGFFFVVALWDLLIFCCCCSLYIFGCPCSYHRWGIYINYIIYTSSQKTPDPKPRVIKRVSQLWQWGLLDGHSGDTLTSIGSGSLSTFVIKFLLEARDFAGRWFREKEQKSCASKERFLFFFNWRWKDFLIILNNQIFGQHLWRRWDGILLRIIIYDTYHLGFPECCRKLFFTCAALQVVRVSSESTHRGTCITVPLGVHNSSDRQESSFHYYY